MSARRAILIAGLGRFVHEAPAAEGPSADLVALVKKDVAAATDAGFDCVTYFVDPSESATALAAFAEKLRSQHWAGVMIGFGIRGTPEYTPLFEDLVNTAHTVVPGIKFGFSPTPSSICETAKRMFPEMQQE